MTVASSGECGVLVATPPYAGAIAVVAVIGQVATPLARLTGSADWPVGRVRHLAVDDLDDLLVMRPSDTTALLTPHGGPRIAARLVDRLVECGAERRHPPELPLRAPDGVAAAELRQLYPEADDLHEARMLRLLAVAASPLAIPSLLALPARWRAGVDLDLPQSSVRMILPARVAIVGPPNAGKSTLLNRLVGRDTAIVSDRPGTTRDHVAARVDMAGLVVDLLDTPGLRRTDDPIERDARRISELALADVDLILDLAAPDQKRETLPWATVAPIVRVGGHADRGVRTDAELGVSGLTGLGLDRLRTVVRDRLLKKG